VTHELKKFWNNEVI